MWRDAGPVICLFVPITKNHINKVWRRKRRSLEEKDEATTHSLGVCQRSPLSCCEGVGNVRWLFTGTYLEIESPAVLGLYINKQQYTAQ